MSDASAPARRMLSFDLSQAIRDKPELGADRAAACLSGILLLDSTKKAAALVAIDHDGSLTLTHTDDREAAFPQALPVWGNRQLRDVLLDHRLNGKLAKVRWTLTRRARGSADPTPFYRSKIDTVLNLLNAHRQFIENVFVDPCRRDTDTRFVCHQIADNSVDASILAFPKRSERCSALAAEALAASVAVICDKSPTKEMQVLACATMKVLAMQAVEAKREHCARADVCKKLV